VTQHSSQLRDDHEKNRQGARADYEAAQQSRPFSLFAWAASVGVRFGEAEGIVGAWRNPLARRREPAVVGKESARVLARGELVSVDYSRFPARQVAHEGCSQVGIRREWWGAVSRTTSRSRQRCDLVIRGPIALSTLNYAAQSTRSRRMGRVLGCGDLLLGWAWSCFAGSDLGAVR
jgi:hypothetical protein